VKNSRGNDAEQIRIKVKVVPRAKKNQISGIMEDGSLKVRVVEPPVDGKANQALIKLLADTLKIPKTDVAIISGLQNRNKIVRIEGLSLEEYQQTIRPLFD